MFLKRSEEALVNLSTPEKVLAFPSSEEDAAVPAATLIVMGEEPCTSVTGARNGRGGDIPQRAVAAPIREIARDEICASCHFVINVSQFADER
jgi:hypothetical protein